jgi:ubiquitin-like protein ATG12
MSDNPTQDLVPSPSPSPSPSTASPMPLADNDGAGSGAASPSLPLTMSASVVLADLPRDASAALATAGSFQTDKIVVRFKPVGSAPSLAQDVCKISSTKRFEAVVIYLRKKLRCKETDSVFLYINSAFAPSLDEIVGNLQQVSIAPITWPTWCWITR